MRRNSPADLLGISRTASAFFDLITKDWTTYGKLVDASRLETDETSGLSSIGEQGLEQLLALVDEINRAIREDVQGLFQEGLVIKDGYDGKLDELRHIRGNSAHVLDEYMDRLKEQMGIEKVKLGQNRIIGHYVEISKANVSKVPDDLIRKQTLVNAERYTSRELMEMDQQILQGSFAAEEREKQVYKALVERCADAHDLLLALGNTLSRIDVLQALATVAVELNYCRPVFAEEDSLCIKDGRHAVVEKQLGPGVFVANSLEFTEDSKRFALITGPNMAGKSTYLRQCALIIILAQVGSFVPAAACSLSLVDKLFCRVGASDNLARGESTFMVEMQEAARILRTATRKSFVIMDEIGRGTSTQDGMSLAFAFMNYLVGLGAKCLFATHYHELTLLDTSKVQLKTLQVEEQGKQVIFVRKVIDGIATSSYGLHVAKLAGVPASILKDASRFQRKYFSSYVMGSMDMDLFSSFLLDEMDKKEQVQETDIPDFSPILDEIASFDLEHATPMQAMLFVQKLKDEIGKEEREKDGLGMQPL
jgi:DNA mismatch repair protein MutS